MKTREETCCAGLTFLMAAFVSDSLSLVGSDGGRRGFGSEAVRCILAEECLQAGSHQVWNSMSEQSLLKK